MIGKRIAEAKQWLEKEDVVAIPTETVYGLAGNALSAQAVSRIYAVKNRPSFNPLILHFASPAALNDLVTTIPLQAKALMEAFWPGPLTLLLPKSERVPDLTTAGNQLAAFRMPNHPVTLELLNALSFPLAAPSANPSGYISPTQANHVEEQLGQSIPYILDGGSCRMGLESTIVGWLNNEPTVFRYGALPVEEIEAITGKLALPVDHKLQAPGMLSSHYAPETRLVLDATDEEKQKHNPQDIIEMRFQNQGIGEWEKIVLSTAGNLAEAARHLFATMRELDNKNKRIIFAQTVPDVGIGKAINDRLRRASARN